MLECLKLFSVLISDEEELERMTVNKPTFTLARIVNESLSMKKLLDLGVNLSQWEKNGKVFHAGFLPDVALFKIVDNRKPACYVH